MEKTESIKFEWNWKAHMKSLILFMEMGNNDNRKYAKDELMRIANRLDKYNEENPVPSGYLNVPEK